jgi:hypothetical protein
MKLIHFALLGIGLAAPAHAAGPDCALIRSLDQWVSADTGISGGIDCKMVSFGSFDGVALRSQAGAFYPETGRIEVAEGLDLSKPYGQSFLLHELVHAAQARRGPLACEGRLEAEAYGVQARFLKAHGEDDEARAMIAMASLLGSCGTPEY